MVEQIKAPETTEAKNQVQETPKQTFDKAFSKLAKPLSYVDETNANINISAKALADGSRQISKIQSDAVNGTKVFTVTIDKSGFYSAKFS